MAYIEKRQKRDGSVTYRAQVRVKGFPAQAHTFRRKADAVKWARQIEAAIDERRTTNDERRTTNDERRTTNDERRTTNDERRTTNDDSLRYPPRSVI